MKMSSSPHSVGHLSTPPSLSLHVPYHLPGPLHGLELLTACSLGSHTSYLGVLRDRKWKIPGWLNATPGSATVLLLHVLLVRESSLRTHPELRTWRQAPSLDLDGKYYCIHLWKHTLPCSPTQSVPKSYPFYLLNTSQMYLPLSFSTASPSAGHHFFYPESLS